MASSGKTTYTASQQLEILSWQSLALTSPAAVQRLELFLQTSHRSFLCSFQRFSLADSAVASAIIANEALLSAAAALPEVRRWLRTILSLMKEPLPKVLVPSIEATLLPIPAPVGTAAAAAATTTTAAAAAAAATSAPTSIPEKAVAKVSEKKAKATTPTAFATTAPAASEEGEESLDPSKLDLRVGLITKCWNHPEAEKLLCEEIDLAEPTGPRSIASGLRAHYSAEAMVGKKVIVVANLKEAKLVGFKSNGMVLCACTADKSSVKLLEAPADATVGERVVFEGFSGEAASSSVMAKKKVLEKLAPGVIYNS
jgi:aminoacyl tRNA synthase complex-interacting multifunctional protein 1